MKGGKKLQTRVLHKPSGLKPMVRGIGRLNYGSVARQAMKVNRIRSKILTILATDIQKELTQMCARKHKSVFRNATPEYLKSFTWDTLLLELDSRAPIFSRVLRGIIQVKCRIRNRTPQKKGRKCSRSSEEAVLGVCAAIMLRHRNVHMNLLQRIVSLILYNGHASKQVYLIGQ